MLFGSSPFKRYTQTIEDQGMSRMLRRIVISLITLLTISFSSGCAKSVAHPQDPMEKYNRAMFGFNRAFDRAVTKPIAYIYFGFVPNLFQEGIGNFFDNIREIQNVTNDLLQLKFSYASRDASRFLINSTIGIFGLFDVADALGLEHRKEDFGQTLYHWGYKESAYFVIPFLGPSTVRDAGGLLVDWFALSIWPWIETDWRYKLLILDLIDLRARALRNETVLDILAVDEYVFIRDAYFQRRQYLFNQEKEESNGVDPYAHEDLEKGNKQKVTTKQEDDFYFDDIGQPDNT